MQHIHNALKPNRVERPISIAIEVLDNLENLGPLTLPWLRPRVLAAKLRYAKHIAHIAFHRLRECHEVTLSRADPQEGPFDRGLGRRTIVRNIPIKV